MISKSNNKLERNELANRKLSFCRRERGEGNLSAYSLKQKAPLEIYWFFPAFTPRLQMRHWLNVLLFLLHLTYRCLCLCMHVCMCVHVYTISFHPDQPVWVDFRRWGYTSFWSPFPLGKSEGFWDHFFLHLNLHSRLILEYWLDPYCEAKWHSIKSLVSV